MNADDVQVVRERHRLAREAGIGVPIYEAALLAEVERLRERLTVALHAQAMADAGGIAVRDLPVGAVQASRLIEARDTARRAALEEAIGVCADRVAVNQALAITLGHEHLTSRAEGADECIGDLRALIDTPRTDPVRPAPVGASEEP